MHGNTNPRDPLELPEPASTYAEEESIGDLRLSVRIWSCLQNLVELESARIPRLHGTLGRDNGIDPVRIERLFLMEKSDEIANNASQCLPHVTRYDVEASQGAAASECARAAPDGGSSTLAQRRGLKWFVCRKLFFTAKHKGGLRRRSTERDAQPSMATSTNFNSRSTIVLEIEMVGMVRVTALTVT
ncbi:hypothetical protein Q1695_016364 [Nippostrongylus brasiliensis]|nr:hypothetical protein Q1695_016364 [Nippostrongylus brasiliensis]